MMKDMPWTIRGLQKRQDGSQKLLSKKGCKKPWNGIKCAYMKGVILAGGTGTRLLPLTRVTNKHLLPIYDRPMIYYPIEKLKEMGVTSILLVSGRAHIGDFLDLLGGGKELSVQISYEVQEEAGGIAQALALARNFVGQDNMVVLLGDKNGTAKAHVLLKEVANPKSYGVPRFDGSPESCNDGSGKIVEIIEKPAEPPSSYAVTGCYFYTPEVFDIISLLKPSKRGELEITDVNHYYVGEGSLTHSVLSRFWGDCGESIDGMLAVSNYIKQNFH